MMYEWGLCYKVGGVRADDGTTKWRGTSTQLQREQLGAIVLWWEVLLLRKREPVDERTLNVWWILPAEEEGKFA
jgi:hypothetical protein